MAAGPSLLSLAVLTASALAAAPSPHAARPLGSAAPPSASAPPSPSPSPVTAPKGPTILFLIDNSASLPPLDPQEKRVEALEKMFAFLQGRPYRLILFGGRHEVFVDDVTKYRNNGLWTDFYFAFDRARDLMASDYPPGTEFRIVLITDAILDPNPADWQDMNVPPDADFKAYAAQKTLDLVRTLEAPLYVILVGDPPSPTIKGSPERAPGLILEMVQAA